MAYKIPKKEEHTKVIKRSYLKKLKKEYKSESIGDIEFLEWYERSHGLGLYPDTKFKIIE